MVCRRVTSFLQLLAVLTLILLTSVKSFSHARRVLEVSTVVATDKEFEVHGGMSLSSQKENIVGGDVPSTAAEVKAYKIGGRRMSNKSADQKGKIITELAANPSALIHGAGEFEKEEHWQQVLMAFAVDYTSPRAHPPSHN